MMAQGISDFLSAMASAGVVPAEPIAGKLASGRLIRFRCEGDGKKRNGWAIYFDGERPGGAYGNHKQNTGTITWSARREAPALSAEERARLREQIALDEARRVVEQRDGQHRAAQEALAGWQMAGPASPDHPYAQRKRLRLGGLRQVGDALLVPMRDIDGNLWNLQRIYPDGGKRFLKGGRITGLSAIIGLRPEFSRGVFAEGYATGEAISQALGDRPVIVAFNTANLAPVVREWTRLHARADWVIAADDDHLTGLKMVERGQPYQNPGVDKARAVAAEFGCRVAYPPNVCSAGRNVDFSDIWLGDAPEGVRLAFDAAHRKADQPSLAEKIGLGASTSAALGLQERAA